MMMKNKQQERRCFISFIFALTLILILLVLKNPQEDEEQQQQRQAQSKKRQFHDESIDSGMLAFHYQNQQQQKQQLLRLPRKGKIRIVNGRNANPIDRYPYFVSLVDRTNTHRCGGTLIAPDIVLTAAHCKAAILEFAIVGLHDRSHGVTSSSSSTSSHEIFEIVQELSNPLWSWETRFFDQMILKLSGSVPSTIATPIRVNFDSSAILLEDYESSTKANMTIIGFGKTLIPGGSSSPSSSFDNPDILQQAHVTYMRNEICEQAKDARGWLSYKGLITDDMMCIIGSNVADDLSSGEGSLPGNSVGSGGTIPGHCQGDSGGPVLLLGDTYESDVQLGIISWARGCGDPNFPGVAARTSSSDDFIRRATCQLSNHDLPSNDFHCEEIGENGGYTNEEDDFSPPDGDLVPITVSILFDEKPEEISWMITSRKSLEGDDASEEDEMEIWKNVAPGTYRFDDEIVEKVWLPPNDTYVFTIQDTTGNGIDVTGIAYEILYIAPQESTPSDAVSIMVEGTGNFGRSISHEFHVPAAPHQPPPPSEVEDGIDSNSDNECVTLHGTCSDHMDCCSGRCSWGSCRLSGSTNGRRQSLGAGLHGGSAGTVRHNFGN